MKFKDIEFSRVPAFDYLQRRLEVLCPAYSPAKAGVEFDFDLYRVYVQNPKQMKFPIDMPGNLLRDIEQNSHGTPSSYTRGLSAKLDEIIETEMHGVQKALHLA